MIKKFNEFLNEGKEESALAKYLSVPVSSVKKDADHEYTIDDETYTIGTEKDIRSWGDFKKTDRPEYILASSVDAKADDVETIKINDVLYYIIKH